ncbi:MAG TPA: hypothetical protein DCQ93_02660, partial [Bacteroidetes bacterium]|nr:hypothetical protein [Bacteroidota bacterium]
MAKEILDNEFWESFSKSILHKWIVWSHQIGKWKLGQYFNNVPTTKSNVELQEECELLIGLANSYDVTPSDLENHSFSQGGKTNEEFKLNSDEKTIMFAVYRSLIDGQLGAMSYWNRSDAQEFASENNLSIESEKREVQKKIDELKSDIKFISQKSELPLIGKYDWLKILHNTEVLPHTHQGRELFGDENDKLGDKYYKVYEKLYQRMEKFIEKNYGEINYDRGGKTNWIQSAIHHPGALRNKAKEMGLIKGDETLSEKDLSTLEKLGGVWKKRVTLARTLRKFEEGGGVYDWEVITKKDGRKKYTRMADGYSQEIMEKKDGTAYVTTIDQFSLSSASNTFSKSDISDDFSNISEAKKYADEILKNKFEHGGSPADFGLWEYLKIRIEEFLTSKGFLFPSVWNFDKPFKHGSNEYVIDTMALTDKTKVEKATLVMFEYPVTTTTPVAEFHYNANGDELIATSTEFNWSNENVYAKGGKTKMKDGGSVNENSTVEDYKKYGWAKSLINEDVYAEGGSVSDDEKYYVANEIVNQLGGMRRLKMFTGAFNFIAYPNGVSFKLPDEYGGANYIKITLNGMDLYDVESGRISKDEIGVPSYKKLHEHNGVYNDMLIDIFEKDTKMFLHFEKGGKTQMKKGGKANIGIRKFDTDARVTQTDRVDTYEWWLNNIDEDGRHLEGKVLVYKTLVNRGDHNPSVSVEVIPNIIDVNDNINYEENKNLIYDSIIAEIGRMDVYAEGTKFEKGGKMNNEYLEQPMKDLWLVMREHSEQVFGIFETEAEADKVMHKTNVDLTATHLKVPQKKWDDGKVNVGNIKGYLMSYRKNFGYEAGGPVNESDKTLGINTNEDWFDSITPGSRVTIVTPKGQQRTGIAVMKHRDGKYWRLNMGGTHGRIGVATRDNVVFVKTDYAYGGLTPSESVADAMRKAG